MTDVSNLSHSLVILVDNEDNEIGVMEKMEAHRKGKLHRAFSVILQNEKGDFLVQKRADNKYHSAGLWSNSCCSHPLPGEDLKKAVGRRLMEEISAQSEVDFMFKFKYQVSLDNNLVEHEIDHVFKGIINFVPKPNEEEVSELKFISETDLREDMNDNPHSYTYWFHEIMSRI